MLNTATRLHYLEAIGVDVWVPRQAQIAPANETDAAADAREALQSLPAVENSEARIESASFASAPVETLEGDAEDRPTIPDSEQSWRDLHDEVAACRKCALCETRTQTVFGTGSASSGWMLVGEAPGESEDRQGEPFVGRAGQLLTEMLRAIGLKRDDVFITNILKCRPPNNRDPAPAEVEACSDYLQRQIAWIKPKIILAVGRISAQNLLKTDKPIGQLRGRVHSLNGIPLVVVYHPAYLLRSPLEKRKAWQDLQLAITTFDEIKG